MFTIYRRHKKGRKHRAKGRKHRHCQCPSGETPQGWLSVGASKIIEPEPTSSKPISG